MFCNKCGTENVKEAGFCTGCGADLSKQTPFEEKPAAGPADLSDPLDESPTIFQSEIEPYAFKVGTLFDGRYEILGEGKKGGMGVVYKVKDTKLNKLSALKIIHPRLIDSSEAITRFRQEVSISRDLHNPNIVRVYDLQEWEGKEYFTMEWVDGVTLREILDRRKKQNRQFTLVEADNMISQLSEALHYAHTYIVHRDIKPENVIIESGKRDDDFVDISSANIKLTDFGIAKMLSQSHITMTSMKLGTLDYMPPEQKTDAGKVDKRADIYAAGVVLFELLTLQNTIGPEMPSDINTNLPQEVDGVYKRAVAANPEKRYSSIKDFAGALNKIAVAEKKRMVEETKKAEKEKQNAIKKQRQIDSLLKEGKFYLRHNNLDKAIEKFEFALNIDADHKEAEELLTKVRAEKKKAGERALMRLKQKEHKEKKVEDRKLRVESLLQDGRSRLDKKYFDSAIKASEEVLRIDPKNREAKTLLQKSKEEKDRLRDEQESRKKLEEEREKRVKQAELSERENQKTKKPKSRGKIIIITAVTICSIIGIVLGILLSSKDNKKLHQAITGISQETASKLEAKSRVKDLMDKAKASEGEVKYKKALEFYEEAKSLDPNIPNIDSLIASVKQKRQRAKDLIEKTSTSSTARARQGDYVEMVLVRGGSFRMGDTFGDGSNTEKPVHNVTVGDFYIGKYEVTQGAWEEIMGNNPSFFKNGRDYPVEQVSWNDVQKFIRKLNQKKGKNYRLPTEAEWEYTARSAGKREKYAGTSSGSSLRHYAWYSSNSGRKTHPVGQMKPNELGIYDMTGNVYEWCQDIYSEHAYSKHKRSNPIYTGSGSHRVVRGGSYSEPPMYLRASFRGGGHTGDRMQDVGFRLARTP